MKKDILPPDIKSILPTIGIFVVLIFVGFNLLKIGWDQISKQASELKVLRLEDRVLSEKQSILSEIQGNILVQADMALQVLPDQNPSLAIISQVKTLAFERGLILTKINAGAETQEENGFSKVDVTVEMQGTPSLVMDYVLVLKRIAPLVNIGKVNITGAAGSTQAIVTITGYWSELPSKIASVSTPINDLAADELDLLNEFSGRLFPSFVVSAPEEPVSRENPFN